MVVFTLLWPSKTWMVRISVPDSSKCVAKECRKVWQVTRLGILARAAASVTAFCTELG